MLLRASSVYREDDDEKTITDGLSFLCMAMTQHYMDEQIFEKSLRKGIVAIIVARQLLDDTF
jgi:hypothetical protein